MTFHDKPRYCESCHETLPGAAAGRCPFCRAPLASAGRALAVTCRRCSSPIPRAGAGKCPVCTTRGTHATRVRRAPAAGGVLR